MISIRKVESSEKNILKEYILSNGLSLKEDNVYNIYIAIFSGKSIMGFTYTSILENGRALIKNIYITPEYRNEGLGDGIFRSTLHFLSNNGFSNISIETNASIADFLEKRKTGLSEEISNLTTNMDEINNKIYLCDLNILLRTKCRV